MVKWQFDPPKHIFYFKIKNNYLHHASILTKADRCVESGRRFVGKTKPLPFFLHRLEIKGARSLKKSVLPSFLVVCTQLATTTLRAQSVSPHPNIVVILADDLGYGDVSFNGCPYYSTPNSDSLASSGMWCSNGYLTQAFCSPSRAALLTDRYQQRFGHENQSDDDASNPRLGLPVQELLLPQIHRPKVQYPARSSSDDIELYDNHPFLRKAGCICGIVGKWRLVVAPNLRLNQRGFDEFFGFLGSCSHWHKLG